MGDHWSASIGLVCLSELIFQNNVDLVYVMVFNIKLVGG